MNASGVNQYLSPARSAATACAYSCPYSTERSGRMFPFISMQTKRWLPVGSASKSQLLRFLFRIKVPPHSCLSYYYLYLYCHVIDYSTFRLRSNTFSTLGKNLFDLRQKHTKKAGKR